MLAVLDMNNNWGTTESSVPLYVRPRVHHARVLDVKGQRNVDSLKRYKLFQSSCLWLFL